MKNQMKNFSPEHSSAGVGQLNSNSVQNTLPDLPKIATQAKDMSRLNTLIVEKMNALFVSIYKAFGFVLLGFIVLAMASYLASATFYQVSNRWAVPMILEPENSRVAAATAEHLQLKYQLDKLRVEKAQVEHQLQVVRTASEGKMKLEKAMNSALEHEKQKNEKRLLQISELLKSLKSTAKIANSAAIDLKEEELKALAAAQSANLLARREILDRTNSIGQLDMNRVERIKKIQELEAMFDDLQTSQESAPERNLAAVKDQKQLFELQLDRLSYETQLLPLEAARTSLDELIAAYDKNLARQSLSPFVKAKGGTITIALAPYENLQLVSKGAPVFGCYLKFIMCKKIGEVVALLPGESAGIHPISGRNFRGQFFEIRFFDEPESSSSEASIARLRKWAEGESLIVGRPPLFI